MKRIQLHTKVALTKDVPEFDLKQGDIAVVAEVQRGKKEPDEFLIIVTNAVGETIAAIPVYAAHIRELRSGEILHVRSLQSPALAEPLNQYPH